MDIVKTPKIDWLGLKWVFICISLVLVSLGGISMLTRGVKLGVDFTGGTLVYVKFKQEPELDRVRQTLGRAGLRAEEVIRFDDLALNEVQIRMARSEVIEGQDLTEESSQVFDTLREEYDGEQVGTGKRDLNNVSRTELAAFLENADPAAIASQEPPGGPGRYYRDLADRMIDARTDQGGLLDSDARLQELGLPLEILDFLRDQFYLGEFTIISVESVGPKVGEELRTRARAAIFFSLLGMLAYIWLRFWLSYGLAAIAALFHDVFITVGAFSLTDREISLTVVAALLTLVGYSINDTIVVFDRVRENLRLMRRKDLALVINTSINQTLNRTIMTSGMTFLAVFSLYLFGGEVLRSFSFALVVGILVGTYSSIAIASPIVLWWESSRQKKKEKK